MVESYADIAGNGRLTKSVEKGRLVKPSARYDGLREYLTDSPTPSKLSALLKRVDRGDIHFLVGMQLEMEAKSAQLQGVAETRRNAITSLDWCIEPDQDLADDNLANEVADYCTQTLAKIGGWANALDHLSGAIGPNIAVLELIWDKAELVDVSCVPYPRLRTHPITNMGVAIETEEEPLGIPTEMFPGKFVVFHRHWNGGFPFRRTLTHATVLPYLFINLSHKDWGAFSEVFGHPLRHGTAPASMEVEDRDILGDMLTNMGSDSAAMFPEGTEIGFLQATGTGETYQRQLEFADTKLAILWLGQNLTTQISDQGSRAAAEVHDAVRGDLLRADLMAEAACIRSQIIWPMLALRYPGREVPVPYFVRKVEKGRDVEGERLTLDQLRFARESGLRIDEDVIYDKLSLPRPEVAAVETEDDAVTVTFNELTLGIERAIALGDLAFVNALRDQIAKMLGQKLPPLTELPKNEPTKLTAGTAPDEPPTDGEPDEE